MALIKTITEIKSIIPRLVSQLGANASLPNFDRVETKYILPVVGKAQLDSIAAKYQANTTMTPTETGLLKKMQLLAVAWAFHDELIFTHAIITDSGVKKATTGNMQPVYGWEFKELKQSLQDTALDATDALIGYLFDNKALLPLWATSKEFLLFENMLIKTAAEFDALEKLHQPFRTFYGIRSKISDAQHQHIRQAIGQELLQYFIENEDPSDEEQFVLQLLKKSLALYTVAKAVQHYAVRFDETGFTILNSSGNEVTENRTSGSQLIEMKRRAAETDGAAYLAMARNELMKIRKSEAVGEDFAAAYDIGPLAGYNADRSRGNGSLKGIFRF